MHKENVEDKNIEKKEEEQITENEKSQGETVPDKSSDRDETLADSAQDEKAGEVKGQDELESIKNDLEESKDKYLRLYSEFENFRRRTARERIELIGTATKDLILDLLPVMDDFERALKSLQEKSGKETDLARKGLELIYHKFKNILDQKGLKKIEIKAGDKFNDDLHEAITQTPAGKKMEGKVVDVIEHGYTLHEKVIRFAKVVTGAKS